jgi:hypothetical protein
MARSFIPLFVVISIQALAGCGMPAMPAKSSVAANDDRSYLRVAERKASEARLRKQVEDGTLGRSQLFPGGMKVDARHLAPLPPTYATAPVRSLGVPAPRSSEAAVPTQPMQPMQFASAVTAGKADACVFKAVMSDADIDACR